MPTPRVHLLMPVYNSFSYERSDGKRLLPLAINALLRQTFKDFELIILDNQSTDDTPKICERYAAMDSRVRFIVDDQKRFAEAAITKLGGMATAPYCMIINDDDMWDDKYLKEAVTYLDQHPQADMVYGKGLFFNPQNILTGERIPKENEKYGDNLTRLERFIRYSNLRNILPIHYGLFRTEAFKKTLPYEDFNSLKADIDNVFMANFFARGYQADYCEKLVFLYRRKSRTLNPKKFAFDMPSLEKPIGLWLYYANHQMLFFLKLMTVAQRAGFAGEELDLIRSSVMSSCINNSLNLIRWARQEIEVQDKYHLEVAKLKKLEEKYKETLKTRNVTLESYRDFINYANAQENSQESRSFAEKIIKVLDTEITWYKTNKNAGERYVEISLKAKARWHDLLAEKVRDHPLLKKTLIGMLSVYLTIKYFPIYYPLMRDTKKEI